MDSDRMLVRCSGRNHSLFVHFCFVGQPWSDKLCLFQCWLGDAEQQSKDVWHGFLVDPVGHMEGCWYGSKYCGFKEI